MSRLAFPAVALGVAMAPWVATDVATAQITLNNVPTGMVSYFTTSGQTTCPTGWQAASYAVGRLGLPVATSANAGISVGTAMANMTPPVHDHSYAGSATVEVHHSASGGGSRSGIIQSGGHGVSGTSAPADPGYPFVQYLVCEAVATTGTDDIPFGSYAFFSPQTDGCPTGWSAATNFNGFFLVPGSSQFAIGTTVGTAITVNGSAQTINLPTHTHSFSTSINVGSISFTGMDGGSDAKGNANPVPVTATLAANTAPVVPVVTMLLCEKTQVTIQTTLPLGLSVFFSAQQCPTAFGIAAASAGNFVVGLGGTGTQGQVFGGKALLPGQGSGGPGDAAMPTHNHLVPQPTPTEPTGEVNLGNNSTYLAHGSDYTFGAGGTYPYSGNSGSTEVDLPYAPLMLCTVTSSS